jgi:hypothetical protein
MILVNISAVGTSTTLTLQPVACSHFGPEKLSGSSDCRPASQTIVMVFPAQTFLGRVHGPLGGALRGGRWGPEGGEGGEREQQCAMERHGCPQAESSLKHGVVSSRRLRICRAAKLHGGPEAAMIMVIRARTSPPWENPCAKARAHRPNIGVPCDGRSPCKPMRSRAT